MLNGFTTQYLHFKDLYGGSLIYTSPINKEIDQK